MNKIKIVDSIMGSGKTEGAINLIKKSNYDSKFVFITPYLKEIERVKDSCGENKKFFDPINKGQGKLESLHYLLQNGKNIASTHALFQTATDVTRDLIKDGEYILILDEVFNVIEEYDIKKDDYDILSKEKMIYEDNGYILWNQEYINYDGKYNDIKNLCLNRNLMTYAGKIFMWVFPVDIFSSFKEVYILTYMFDAQEQKYYYDMHNVEYEYYYATKENEEYIFKLKDETYSEKSIIDSIKKNINICDDKINNIGDNYYALSSSWFDKKDNKPLVKKLQKNMYNYFTNKLKVKSDKIIWTTYKNNKSDLAGKGYSKAFLNCVARATNEYSNRNCLAYCINVFLNPIMEQFFIKRGIKVNEDLYALSNMLQWIWRSSIRKNEPINVYIPSARMRELLIKWLNCEI